MVRSADAAWREALPEASTVEPVFYVNLVAPDDWRETAANVLAGIALGWLLGWVVRVLFFS
jgi:hypothetical protein